MLNPANITPNGNGSYSVSYGNDKGVIARFYKDAIQDQGQTEEQGRPIYKNVDMVEIRFAGDASKVINRPVQHEQIGDVPPDPVRFPRQWELFKAEQEQGHEGTPLEHWPPLDKAQVLNLKAANIFTVEQLASISDANLKFMGARQLRENARAWLDEAEAGGAIIALRNENEALKRDIEALKNTIEGLQSAKQQSATQEPVDVVSSVEATPMPEADIKPIKGKMRKRVAENGENTSPNGTASGE